MNHFEYSFIIRLTKNNVKNTLAQTTDNGQRTTDKEEGRKSGKTEA